MNSFALSATPLDPATLARDLQDPAAGGLVIFEGRVRHENEGRSVRALDYEAYEPLCLREGTRILTEAVERFGLRGARCVHRTGALKLGETAVWVGVLAGHRAEAFTACRWIIDEIKRRLPIWKREHYADGTSAWVRCEACAGDAGGHSHGRSNGDGHA